MKLLGKYKLMIQDLQELQPNLSFTQSQMIAAMATVQQDKKWTDGFKDTQEAKHHGKTIAKRIRAACRHVQQGVGRKQRPKWVVDYDFAAERSDDDEEDPHADCVHIAPR